MTYAKNRIDFNNLNSFYNMLKELFKSAFPHSDIDEINTATYLGSESKGEYIYVISEIIVNFNNLDDIKITEP